MRLKRSHVVVSGALALVALLVLQFRHGPERKIEKTRSAVVTLQDGTHAGSAPAGQQPLAGAAGPATLPRAPALPVEPKHTDSAQLVKPLKEAHDDLQAKKYAEAIAKLKEADNIIGKNAYDQHLINDFLGYSYAHTYDYADAAKAWEMEVDDGLTPPADQNLRVRALSQLNYQIKKYDKAIQYGQRAIKGGYGDDVVQRVVGQAYYLKGDWKGTLEFEGDLVSAGIKRGETPAKESLLLIYSACVKL